eukprot:GILI01008331.1.p1 GENE.GILI01008331.1~~GILI01008331.1.p1  ORF type:complete len:690 (-),score=124.72 GILI01008331.1:488-2476(-)
MPTSTTDILTSSSMLPTLTATTTSLTSPSPVFELPNTTATTSPPDDLEKYQNKSTADGQTNTGIYTVAVAALPGTLAGGPDALLSMQLLALFVMVACSIPGVNKGGMSSLLTPLRLSDLNRFEGLVGQMVVIVGAYMAYGAAVLVLSLFVQGGIKRSLEILRHPRAVPHVHQLALSGFMLEACYLLYGNPSPTVGERVAGAAALAVSIVSIGAYYFIAAQAAWSDTAKAMSMREGAVEEGKLAIAASYNPITGTDAFWVDNAIPYQSEVYTSVPQPFRFLLVPTDHWAKHVLQSGRVVFAASLKPRLYPVTVAHNLVRAALVTIICALPVSSDKECIIVMVLAGAVCVLHAAFVAYARCYRVPIENFLQPGQSLILGSIAFIRAGSVRDNFNDDSVEVASTVMTFAMVVFNACSIAAGISASLIETCIITPKLKGLAEIGNAEELNGQVDFAVGKTVDTDVLSALPSPPTFMEGDDQLFKIHAKTPELYTPRDCDDTKIEAFAVEGIDRRDQRGPELMTFAPVISTAFDQTATPLRAILSTSASSINAQKGNKSSHNNSQNKPVINNLPYHASNHLEVSGNRQQRAASLPNALEMSRGEDPNFAESFAMNHFSSTPSIPQAPFTDLISTDGDLQPNTTVSRRLSKSPRALYLQSSGDEMTNQ